MNNCVDCKHCIIFVYNGFDDFKCKKLYGVDPVTGQKLYTDCSDIRRLYKNCSLFERKVSIIEKIINYLRKLL